MKGNEMFSLVDSAETRAQRGMSRLDEQYGDRWDEMIDLTRLDVASCTNCVLGQIYGEYGIGRALFRAASLDVVDHGFCPFFSLWARFFGLDAWESDAAKLNAAWRDLIGRRRARKLLTEQLVVVSG